MAEESGPANVSVDTSRISSSSLRDDTAFQQIMARQEQQQKLQTKQLTEKIGDALTDAAPLIAGLGLLQMTDSPIIALGGAYFGDKIKDAAQERKSRKQANREEMRLRRMAADIAVEQGQFATREEALLAIQENRSKEETATTKSEQEALLARFGIMKAEEDAVEKQTEAATAQIEMAEKVTEAVTGPGGGDGAQIEMAEKVTEAVAGPSGGDGDSVVWLELIATSLEDFLNLNKADSEREKQRWLEDREARREAARGGGTAIPAVAGDSGVPEKEENSGMLGGLGSALGGGGAAAGAAGGAAGVVKVFGNPAMLKSAGIFAIVLPLIGVGIAGFIAAIGAGIAGASWLMGKALPTLTEGLETIQPALKSFEELDGNKLAAAGSGMSSMLGGLASVGIGGLISGLGDPEGLTKLAKSMQEFEKIDGGKLSLIGPAMVDLGKGLGATGLGSIVGSIGKLFGSDGPEEQFKSVARGLTAFGEVDGDKIAKVGPAVESLGLGIKALGDSGGVFEGLGKSFASFIGVDSNPIDGIKKFEVLGEPETAAKLNSAGQAIKGLADGMNSLKGIDASGFKSLADGFVKPVGDMADSISKAGPDFGTTMLKTVKSFQNLAGLENIKWAEISPGMKKFGEGLETLADYIDDGEIKTLERASVVIEKFGQAFRNMNPTAIPNPVINGDTTTGAAGTTLGQLRMQAVEEEAAMANKANQPSSVVSSVSNNVSNATYNSSPMAVRSTENTMIRKMNGSWGEQDW